MKDDNGFIPKSLSSKPLNPPASTPIPIKLDMTFDGIAGLTMGQLFRVSESRLPQAYRRKNVIFVVVAEDQSVDNNGNWTTKISGQMQLFPSIPKEKPTQFSGDPDFDPKAIADRFYAAIDGAGTDEDEMDALYNELKDNPQNFKRVEDYWIVDFEDRTDGDSLLEWIEGDEDGFRVSLSQGEPPLTEESYKADNPLARNSQLDLNKTEIELGVTKEDKIESQRYGGGMGSMK